jgi:hypothetical protein
METKVVQTTESKSYQWSNFVIIGCENTQIYGGITVRKLIIVQYKPAEMLRTGENI